MDILNKSIRIFNSMIRDGNSKITDGLIEVEISDLINSIDEICEKNKSLSRINSDAIFDLECVIHELRNYD